MEQTLGISVQEPAWLDRGAYPFASKFFPLSQGRLHYIDEGSGPPILMSHGTPTWSFEYRGLIRALAPRYRCIAPDHLGFGLSDRPSGQGYRPEDHAENFARFANGLDLEKVTLVVHDYGGPIALRWALENPTRVARIVVLNSWLWSFRDDPVMSQRARLVSGAFGRWLYAWCNFSLRVLMPSAYGDRRKLTPAVHRQYLSVFPTRKARREVLWALARGLSASSSYFAELEAKASTVLHSTPVLLVWGMRDSAFEPRHLDRWRTLLPHAQVCKLPDAGHWPHEEAPDAVLEAVERFLRGTDEKRL